MKLTKEQENKLTEMAFAEKSNKEIAEELKIDLRDVYAARSRLGITIPKVKQALERGLNPFVKDLIHLSRRIYVTLLKLT